MKNHKLAWYHKSLVLKVAIYEAQHLITPRLIIKACLSEMVTQLELVHQVDKTLLNLQNIIDKILNLAQITKMGMEIMKISLQILEFNFMNLMVLTILDINRHLKETLLLGQRNLDQLFNIKGHNQVQNISEIWLMFKTNTMVIWV